MDECLECCNCCNEYYNNCKDKKKFNEYKKYKHDHIKILEIEDQPIDPETFLREVSEGLNPIKFEDYK